MKAKNKYKKQIRDYKNGGDGMFFYHKKTRHPAKQISHTKKTWSNKRYTHSPNRIKDYEIDEELSENYEIVYATKKIFTDDIRTRGYPYKMKNKKRH